MSKKILLAIAFGLTLVATTPASFAADTPGAPANATDLKSKADDSKKGEKGEARREMHERESAREKTAESHRRAKIQHHRTEGRRAKAP